MQPVVKNVAIRKRTQIEATNKTMFMWVAGSSVLLGFALVGSIFLVQMLLFNERVLNEKNITLTTLKANNANIKELESKVRVLDTNKALMDVRTSTDEQAVRVVLDALPSEANSLALGSSLQNKLIAPVSSFSLDKLQVDPVIGIETLDDGGATAVASSENTITLAFSGMTEVRDGVLPASVLQQILENLEKSIRTINVTSVTINDQTQLDGGQQLMLTVNANAYYQPAVEVKLKDKTVK